MLILHDPDTLLHDTVELLGAKVRPALESSERIRAIIRSIEGSNHALHQVDSPFERSKADLRSLLELARGTHGSDYLQHLEEAFDHWRHAGLIEEDESLLPECFVFSTKAGRVPEPPRDIYARPGYFAFDMSSGIMAKTYASAIASANLARVAVQKIQQLEAKEVLALCRPPGHHCDGHRAGGYCYINNAAVAISAWRQSCPDSRIGIIDVDFHHGNGTQEIFYSDPLVIYTSIHGEDEFPYYTGRSDERGFGDAEGTNLNLPLETGSSFDQYLEKLNIVIEAVQNFNPGFILISLGFDTFRLDPIGNFKIDTEDYEVMASTIRRRLPNLPALILLEGGYVLEHLGANLLSFLKGWEASS